MDEGTNKMTIHEVLHLGDDIYFIWKEKEEENSPTLRIVWMQQFRDSQNIHERAKKYQLQQPITAKSTEIIQGQAEKQ